MNTQTKTDTQIVDGIISQKTYNELNAKWAPKATATPESLPHTELALAREMALILKGKVVYLKSESRWYILDGTDFIETDGDFSVHKAIKHIAKIYNGIIQVVIRDCANIQDKENRAKTLDKYSEHFSMNKKLQSASSLNSFTTILKSELDEVPEGLAKPVPFLTFQDLADEQDVRAFVDGYLPRDGIGQLYGDSYTGKTFVMVDLALSICAGLKSWQGMPLNTDGPSQVLYVAAEGKASFRSAVKDWNKAHPAADISGFYVHDLTGKATLNLTPGDPAPGVFGLNDLREQCEAEGIKPSLVVLDPQANILAGVNEDSNSEMVAALTPLQKWANEEGFLAMLVHHTGKTNKGEGRGASAQKAMMDVLINIKVSAGNEDRSLTFDKVKGAAKPERNLVFRLENGAVSSTTLSPSEAENSGVIVAMNRSVILKLIEDQTATNIASIHRTTKISKERIRTTLEELKLNNQIKDVGSSGHPRWVLITAS